MVETSVNLYACLYINTYVLQSRHLSKRETVSLLSYQSGDWSW